MYSKTNLNIGTTSIATLLITSGINMQMMKIEPSASTLAIWAGVILIISLGIMNIVEKMEKIRDRT